MFYEVIIPGWTEGKPLTVTHIQAETAEEAKQKAISWAPNCPLPIMVARSCHCNVCLEEDLKRFKERLGK